MNDRFVAGETAQDAIVAGISERIIAAARECFEKNGFKKTRIEHIAEAVGVARQTIYNHFSSKQDIIDRISFEEMPKVQDELRGKIRNQSNFADRLTEIIFQSVLLSLENPYLNRMSTDPEAIPLGKDSGPFFEWRQERWRSTLEFGRACGELRSDLEDPQIVAWLSFSQWSLLLRMAQQPTSEEQLRAFLRDFMVEAVLSKTASSVSDESRHIATVQSQLVELKETVVGQALEIKRLRALPRASGH